LEDPKIAEIIRGCKRKNIYDIMGFAKSWNNEVIAQFCHMVLHLLEK
jgi:hypothetical protein